MFRRSLQGHLQVTTPTSPLVRWQGCQQLCPLGAASEISITHGEWDQLRFDWQKALRQMFAGKNLLTIEAFTSRVPPSPSPSSPWVITFTAFCNFGNCFLSSDGGALFLYGSWTLMEPKVLAGGGGNNLVFTTKKVFFILFRGADLYLSRNEMINKVEYEFGKRKHKCITTDMCEKTIFRRIVNFFVN